MKHIFKMGIISTCIGLFFSCKEQVSPLSEDYYKKSGAIYFIPGGNGFERGSRKTDADVNSFSVIRGIYARDKDNIYVMGCPQQFVDTKTFRLKGNIPVDQSHVFVFDGSTTSTTRKCSEQQLIAITDADPETYITLYDTIASLAKDKSHYFYNFQQLAVDYASFKILNENFVKTKIDSMWSHRKVSIRSITQRIRLMCSTTNTSFWMEKNYFITNPIRVWVCSKRIYLRPITSNYLIEKR
ncbi:DKNYY domain-containing protein [Sphingobacterium sp. E70]|uniref:DKNYY domain-containing protein n=1 Tax=Sphingobacterium sp. E70 TaxID=2853439 RepID=UPI00359C9456